MRKRILAGLGAVFIALTAIAAVPETADAARGGARISAPRIGGGTHRAAPSTQPRGNTTARPNQEYKPSKPGTAANPSRPTTPSAAPATSSGTRWGGIMRNIGLLAGGMVLGSLLGHLFGFGASGFMADVLGLLVNGILIYVGIRLVFWLIARFRGNGTERSPYQSAERSPYAGVSRREEPPIQDISPRQESDKGGTDYEPRRTAEWYRRH